jgi:hypothetical protein
MQDFAQTSFHPDLLSAMENALDSAVAKLPHPVRSAHVIAIAVSSCEARVREKEMSELWKRLRS